MTSSSCRFLDKLGLAARNDVDLVMRQSLFSANSHYDVIDKDMNPLPVT